MLRLFIKHRRKEREKTTGTCAGLYNTLSLGVIDSSLDLDQDPGFDQAAVGSCCRQEMQEVPQHIPGTNSSTKKASNYALSPLMQ